MCPCWMAVVERNADGLGAVLQGLLALGSTAHAPKTGPATDAAPLALGERSCTKIVLACLGLGALQPWSVTSSAPVRTGPGGCC